MDKTEYTKCSSRVKDETGNTYGELTVLCFGGTHTTSGGIHIARWICKCGCGRIVNKLGSNIRAGKTKCKKCGTRKTHGQGRGGHPTPEYQCWISMRSRCYRKSCHAYHNYGGRGIFVCDRWDRFENFYSDMGPRPSPNHSIERIDNNGIYSPQNCRWATRKEQQNNMRVNNTITHNGITLNVTEWAEKLNINRATLFTRLRHGWSAEKVLTTPVRKWPTK